MPADHVHFNGSVNLADAESVMREIAARVPAGLRRIPDGETGDRGNWIFFQLQKFLQLPWLVTARSIGEEDGEYEQLPLLRLAEGVDPAQVTWPDIGYAEAYLASYRVFAQLRARSCNRDVLAAKVQAVRADRSNQMSAPFDSIKPAMCSITLGSARTVRQLTHVNPGIGTPQTR